MSDAAKRFVSGRARAYRTTFGSGDGHIVLADLAKFCRAHDTTFLPDARAHAVLEGRREVWLRISKMLNFNDEQLWELFGAHQPRIDE